VIGFLFQSWWWLFGLLVMAGLVFVPAVVIKFRWPIAVGLAAAIALVFWLRADQLSGAIDQIELDAVNSALKNSEAMRVFEAAHARTISDMAAKALQEQADAEQQIEALRADLRSGALRLRQRFTCQASRPAQPGTAAAAAADQQASGLTPADEEALVRIAIDGDDAIRERNLAIAVAQEYRRACLAVSVE
jgi:Bacteriophage Rz lysis protein